MDAMLQIHYHGVVHHDIAPRNILVQGNSEEGQRVRIIDFNLSGMHICQFHTDISVYGYAYESPYVAGCQELFDLATVDLEIWTWRKSFPTIA